MVRQQRFHRGEQVAARNLERAITMRRECFVGWARSAASALRGMLSRSTGLTVTLRTLFRPANRG
jgi:hypothetical protein